MDVIKDHIAIFFLYISSLLFTLCAIIHSLCHKFHIISLSMNNICIQSFGGLINQMLDRELLQRLVIEVRAKNGMTPRRMNHALERLEKTGVIPNIGLS